MERLYATPLSLIRGDLIVVRAAAYNLNGWSTNSALIAEASLEPRVRTKPTTMNSPVRDPASSDSLIVLTWSPLAAAADTGGASVLSYGLSWDDGTTSDPDPSVVQSWHQLSGYTQRTTTTTFTVTTGLIPGRAYLFRLEAENVYGWGPPSTNKEIYAAGLPGQPYQVVTTIEGINARITFQEPENSPAPLKAFKVVVRTAAGDFQEETTDCDAASSEIMERVPASTTLYCDIPLATLRAAPYSLGYQALVQARVQAENTNGWGSLS